MKLLILLKVILKEDYVIWKMHKIGLISEDIVSDLLKDIFGDEGNKSSIKATVSEIVKKQRMTDQ